jgi:hypothetical protein
MNCKEIKYFLLGCENPDQPPAEVKAHLAVCKDCQDWQNRLAVIELNIPFLPVPASAARGQLLRKVLSGSVTVPDDESSQVAVKQPAGLVLRQVEPDATISPAPSLKRKVGILSFFRGLEPSARRFAAGGIAAAILLVVLGWMVMRTPPRTTDRQMARAAADPLLASIIRRDLRLADADQPADRFLALADLADDLSGEVNNLAPLPESKAVLDDLVQRYQEVIRDGLLPVAKKLPPEKSNDLINKVCERLHVAGRKTEELGDQLASKIPNASSEGLRRLTKAAYEGDQRLRDLRVQNVGATGPVLVRRDSL